jgi:uncharacterized protein
MRIESRELNDNELNKLNNYMSRRKAEDDINFNVNFLHGYFCCIISAPYDIPIGDWLGTICEMSELEDEFTQEEVEQYLKLVFIFCNNTRDKMRNGECQAFLFPPTDNIDKKLLQAKDWSKGFFYALNLYDKKVLNEFFMMLTFPCAVLSGEIDLIGEPDNNGKIITDNRSHKEQMLGFIDDLPNLLYNYWQEYQITPSLRKSPKISRNSECPCGSGKKYKKCCLKELLLEE